jgi:hypothetical protein
MTYEERMAQLRADAEKVREMKQDWPEWKRKSSLGPVPKSPDMEVVRAKARALANR